MLLKDLMKEREAYFNCFSVIDTHVYPDESITDFYTKEQLLEKYADREAKIVYYQKDYGEDDEGRPIIATRSYLYIDKEN